MHRLARCRVRLTTAATTSSIVITVSDGKGWHRLPGGLQPHGHGGGHRLRHAELGTAHCSTDGTTLESLAGYRIYYGTSSSNLGQVKQIANPGVTSGVVENLTPATWYFSVRAYSSSGVESAASTPAQQTIS